MRLQLSRKLSHKLSFKSDQSSPQISKTGALIGQIRKMLINALFWYETVPLEFGLVLEIIETNFKLASKVQPARRLLLLLTARPDRCRRRRCRLAQFQRRLVDFVVNFVERG